ncbi:hypothetical protein JCM8202_000077 [Rhodotorula sphaerocarpa]
MFSALLGSVSKSGASTPASSSSGPDSSATASPSDTPPSSTAGVVESAAGSQDRDPFERSAFFQRLKAKGRHDRPRIKEIQDGALRDKPPKEPDPWECCGGSCGLECVVTRWWEEEKTWRDLRPGWRQIKQRLKEEEEDRQREAEEEAAISGPVEAGDAEKRAGAGSPAVGIALEDETREKLAI